MSVSKSVAELKASEKSAIDEKIAKHKLVAKVLDSIPSDTPGLVSVSPFGYCAQASLIFAGDTALAKRLLEMFPPLPCVDLVDGSQSQKPEKYLRPQEKGGKIRQIFPVVLKRSFDETSARWWTTVDGIDIEMGVKGTSFETSALIPPGYSPDVHSYSTGSVAFFVRGMVEPKVMPSAVCEWMQDWMRVGAKEGLTKWSLVCWKNYGLMLAESKNLEETRAFHGFLNQKSNLDDFDNLSALPALERFAHEACKDLPAVLQEQEAQWQRVRDWFKTFISTNGNLDTAGYDVREKIVNVALRELGLDFSVPFFNSHNGVVSLRVTFKSADQFRDFDFKSDTTKPRLLPQAIDVCFV